MNRRMCAALVASAVTAGLVGMTAGTAGAGEITGNGRPKVPNGKSICSYSGLNDGYFDGTETLRVQNWGHEDKPLLRFFGVTPGTLCQGGAEPPP